MQAVAVAAALATTALVAMPVRAQTTEPVKVGVIDTSVDRLILGDKGVTVQRRTFVAEGLEPGRWQGTVGSSHGEVVASSFVQQSRMIDKRVPIMVYSANAFYESGPRNSDGNRAMGIDFKGAEKALEWFHENGVRTVVTAFYAKDSPQMRSFIEKAKEMDIVLFAGTNNDKTKVVPFPARDAYAIAVTGSNANLDFANNPEMAKWTAFKINGDTPTNDMLATSENGSSFAVARAAAYGAHYVRMMPKATKDDVVLVMRQAAGTKKEGRVADLDEGAVMKRFRSIAMSPVPTRLAKGPEGAVVAALDKGLLPGSEPGGR